MIYLILDGVRLGVRGGTREKEAVLVAWAFLEDGRGAGIDDGLLAVEGIEVAWCKDDRRGESYTGEAKDVKNWKGCGLK